MSNPLSILCFTALGLGVLHTLTGPDHYLPFVMLGKANKWSRSKLFFVTAACGIGHILSSIVLGMIGVAAGSALKHLELIESTRGTFAAYGMIIFGTLYCLWGLKRAWKGEPHTHLHVHQPEEVHHHDHDHLSEEHLHQHESDDKNRIWWLFIIFVLGPCEPLIPLLIFPAAVHGWLEVAVVSFVFGAATIGTMTIVTMSAFSGLERVKFPFAEKYSHALAGSAIAISGLAVQFLGL